MHEGGRISLPVQRESGKKKVTLFLQPVGAVKTKVTLGAQEITSFLHAYRLLSV